MSSLPKQPFVAVPQVIRAKYTGSHYGAPWAWLFCLKYDGSRPQNADMSQLATFLRSEWQAYFQTLVENQTTLDLTQCWDLTDAQGAIGQSGISLSGTGIVSSQPPVSACSVVSWPVQARWRGGHFRTYFIMPDMGFVSNGRTLAQGWVDNLTNAMTSFQTNVNQHAFMGGTVKLGGIRYFPTGVDVVRTSGQFYQFQNPIVHTRLDTQRRRLGKE